MENMESILPPMLRRPPGKPQKNRRKKVNETRGSQSKIYKGGVQLTCRKCGKTGHNVRTSSKGEVGSNSRLQNFPISSFILYFQRNCIVDYVILIARALICCYEFFVE